MPLRRGVTGDTGDGDIHVDPAADTDDDTEQNQENQQ